MVLVLDNPAVKHKVLGNFTQFIDIYRIRPINRGKSLNDEAQTSQNRFQHGTLPRFIERIPFILIYTHLSLISKPLISSLITSVFVLFV
jgi:hypothetical protein